MKNFEFVLKCAKFGNIRKSLVFSLMSFIV